MAFCDKEKQLIDGGYTVVDNRFLINYMSDAPDIRSAVYLLGLALSNSNGEDNSCQTIANKLNISTEDVMSAFLYWEELGLVQIDNCIPARITYTALRDSNAALRKINVNKYTKFCNAMQAVIKGRTINTSEANEYIMFLDDTTFEPDALIAVAKYCVELKGDKISYQYVLAVARNLIRRGVTTLATVCEHLNSQQKYDEDLRLVFKAMGTSRKIEHLDRELFEKWSKEFDFSCDVIVVVAKKCKTGGITKLDNLLTEYYKRGALSIKEIDAYEEEKTRLYDLARAINKTIGVYYQSLDSVVEEYVVHWLRKGYDDETLLAVAKYCFKSGIRTLAGLSSVIDKLYKNGVTTLNALDNYLATLAHTDEKIQAVLIRCGLDRRTTANDRALYKVWTENWRMSTEVICYVAQLAAGTNAPMAYINRILSDYKQNGITTVEQAESYKINAPHTAKTTATTAYIGGRDMERRQYTDEEISALFTALDETED